MDFIRKWDHFLRIIPKWDNIPCFCLYSITRPVKEVGVEITILVVASLFAAGWGLWEMQKKGIANFWRFLAETNELHGTSFGTSSDAKATVIGSNLYRGGALAFDRKNRKIAYVTQGGKSIEILGYEFVQSWRLTWREKMGGSGAQFGMVAIGASETRRDNVVLEITTNDVNRPIIKMPMSSFRYAEETAARLKIMINAKN